MAKIRRPKLFAKIEKPKKKRPGVHSKNASRGQNGYKKISRTRSKALINNLLFLYKILDYVKRFILFR